MDSRKIQKSASGSYMITLPKQWVNREGLDNGDTVSLSIENDGTVKIYPPTYKKEEARRECVLLLEEYFSPTLIDRAIKSCYMQGCDIINVVSKKVIQPEWKGQIKNSIVDLIGTEILEEFSNRVTIRTLVDPSKFPMKTILRRMHTLAVTMHQDAIDALLGGNMALAQDVINRSNDVNKLYRLTIRQLTITTINRDVAMDICSSRNLRDCVIVVLASRDIARMAYYSGDIAIQTLELNNREFSREIKEGLLNMSRLAKELQEDALRAFFNDNFSLADNVISHMEDMRAMQREVDKAIFRDVNDAQMAIILSKVSRNIRRLASYSSALSDDTQIRHSPHIGAIKGAGRSGLMADQA